MDGQLEGVWGAEGAGATDSEMEQQRSQFMASAWVECDRIGEALNRHACTIEQSMLFAGREWVFKWVLLFSVSEDGTNVFHSIRMLISYEFKKLIPTPRVLVLRIQVFLA